ncbi:MAG TPA: carboxypeptidase regulatory-like domain-containing protein [Candidatus Acidoferrales bacterium]|nr:carboxypeptidase regulatory-like domain-containing protein [Candidatus Acidoferrales bacterium]
MARREISLVMILLFGPVPAASAVYGSIGGVVTDQSGAVIAGAKVTLTSTAQGIPYRAATDSRGAYSFPSVPVGRYDLAIQASGFERHNRTGLIVDIDSALHVDVTLEVAGRQETVTVTEVSPAAVEAASTQLGEVVTGRSMTAVALNGRSFTDLLALQAGIVPVSTQQPDSIVMAGVTVAIAPSGGLNPGNQSISGQREDANGFMVNGGDVKELMNGGTSIVPNLDSIAEFRILTNNFDPEYGNSSGGIVNVVTKSGTNQLHGAGFEFVRNTALDARNFFSPERSFYRQNQFGGLIGGPILRNRLFFLGDYQGTRQQQGEDTGLIPVPSLANRSGNLADQSDSLTGEVGGPYLAGLLSQKLGYAASANEPYYFPGCASTSACVFPNAVIPERAWSEPARHLLQYIPAPNVGGDTFSTASVGKILRDDKSSFRIDGNSERWGVLSAYYYFDDYHLNNPYPTGQGGATVPGFAALDLGRSQLISLGSTKTFNPFTVNELRVSYMRNSNNVGQPSGGVGPTLASQGFVTGPGTPGITVLAPQIEGIENVRFNSFVTGTPITNLTQANNSFAWSDHLSRVWGNHSIKAGVQVSLEQVNVNPNATFNGSFLFSGSETGSDFADFLIGVASNYNQADSGPYYGRHKYAAGFVQDSWRVRPNLTVNFGVRWDLMQYWSEKYNQIPTFNPGEQSRVYPTAPVSLVYPTDPGIPNTLVPQSNRFSPRLGVAWSPGWTGGLLSRITGGPGKTSVRAGYGVFYSVIQGNTIGIDEPQPPYGLSYTSSGRPLFATPFINSADGSVHVNPFPITIPPLNASAQHPNASIDYSPFLPQAGMTAPPPWNQYPYNENYFLAIERQLTASMLMSLSYVGSQAHHLLVVYSANPGNPALCLALSRPAAVAPGTPTCGPFGEDATYVTAAGRVYQGTRGPLGSNFANDDYDSSTGNSNYSSFQAGLRHSGSRLNLMLAYTFSKSIDQASSLADPIDPFNFRLTRALSAWDLRHSVVATFDYQLPLDHLFSGAKALTRGWSISGITRASTGFPVTISSDGDRSLQGSLPNGVNNRSLDRPDFAPGPLQLNHDPRNGLEYFNTSLFSPNVLGTPGTASRRSFYGPGAINFDIALRRIFKFTESRALEFRFETFNTFNHTQFFGPVAVNGDIDSALFGQVVRAASPRLAQAALKFTF